MVKTFVIQAAVQQTTSSNELPVIRTVQAVLEDHMPEFFFIPYFILECLQWKGQRDLVTARIVSSGVKT